MAKPLIPVADAAAIVNSLAAQHLGTGVVVNDDLSNITDFGKAYENLDSSTKQIVKSGMITLVTSQLFLVKTYRGNGVDIVRSRSYEPNDGIIQKNRPALPQAVSDAEVYDPATGSTSDPFKNYPINFETEYFFNPIQYRYQWSKPERWMTGMFLSADGFMNAVQAIDQSIENAIALNIEDTTMSAIRASMVLNLSTAKENLAGEGTTQAVNLLAKFNKAYATDLKAAAALQNPEFMRYAIHEIFVTMDYMKSYSAMYNEKKFPNYTRPEEMHFIQLSQFRRSIDQFVLSDAFHDEYLKLPNGETVAAWKGFLLSATGTPDFESTSTINDTVEVDWEQDPITVHTSGVLATIFDKERVGIYDLSKKQTNQADAVGLKTNYFTHIFGKSIVDPYENGVTFYIKDAE